MRTATRARRDGAPRAVLLGAALLTLGLHAGRAQAQPEAPAVTLETHIEWSIRARCPTAVAVSARLDAYLRESDEHLPLSVSLRVSEPQPERFAVALELVRGPRTSRREVEGASCAEVLEASLLVVAIAADPELAGRPPPSGLTLAEVTAPAEPPDVEVEAPAVAEAEPPAPAEVEPVEELPVVAAVEPERPARAPEPAAPAETEAPGGPDLAFIGRLGLALSVDALPEPSFGLAAEGGVRLVDLVELALGFQWHSEVGRAVSATQGGTFAAYEGFARVGLVLAIEFFELVPAVRVGAAAMTGRAYGVSRPIAATTGWYTLGGGLEARFRWSVSGGVDMAAVLGFDLLGSLVRPEFVIVGGASVYRPPELTGAYSLGLRVFVR